jgi:hypothetical protein
VLTRFVQSSPQKEKTGAGMNWDGEIGAKSVKNPNVAATSDRKAAGYAPVGKTPISAHVPSSWRVLFVCCETVNDLLKDIKKRPTHRVETQERQQVLMR